MMTHAPAAAAAVRLHQRWGAALEWTSLTSNHRKGRFPNMLHEGAERPPFDFGLTAWEPEPGNISWLEAQALKFIWAPGLGHTRVC